MTSLFICHLAIFLWQTHLRLIGLANCELDHIDDVPDFNELKLIDFGAEV